MKRLDPVREHAMRQAAERYALADSSDPFVRARAMTHLRNGIADYATKDGGIGHYNADEVQETRYLPKADGKTADITKPYNVTVYRNMVRP